MAAAPTTVPRTMKGVVVEKTGGVEVLEFRTDIPVPEPGEGEILVKNEYIGVNYIDTYFRTGLYASPKPEILGREACGHIASTGPNVPPLFAPGTRIAFLATGTYAEYTSAPYAKAVPVPAGLSSDLAAAVLLQGLTALTLIRESHPVKHGDFVLVHAAAGGMGLWLCQLLKWVGARTIGTASTVAKGELAKENGAEWVVDYSRESVVERVREITGGDGVVAVFDGVGKDTFEGDLEVVARKGTVVSFGNASGPVPPFTIARLSAKNVKLVRPMLYSYIHTREEFDHYASELLRFVEQEKPNINIHKVYPLQDVARAHTDLESRKTTGKLLLKP
ncbi:MAG: NADPH:quinone reductase [Geoglossum umbratile]|nr:MAG: NADPH:quinone reductase [Geoglossum umbratile]